MPTISIQLPAIEADQQVEVEVKLNGQKKKYHYRVEIFAWASAGKTVFAPSSV